MPAHFIDMIAAETFTWRPSPPFERVWGFDDSRDTMTDIVSLSREAIVFDITNIAEFYHRTESVHPDDLSAAFPSLTPPDDLVWMEYQGKIDTIAGIRIGVLLKTVRHDAGWSVEMMMVSTRPETPNNVDGPSLRLYLELDRDGALIDDVGPRTLLPETTKANADGTYSPEVQLLAAERLHSLPLIYPVLFALSLLHCKNVTVDTNEGTYTSRQERRAADRRGDKPLTSFRTLQIDPMRKVLETEGGLAENGMKRALHICRGHFAHYGEQYGKGKLFGKIEGRFWMSPHVRGSIEEGVALKDYTIKAPESD